VSRILISGASGLVGSALIPFLESHGCEVKRLVRRGLASANELQWDPMQPISPALVSPFDAVIHLSGENVAGRWTAAKKQRIRDSRVISTHNLSQALLGAQRKPAVFLCASAIGYYGNRGDEILNEESASRSGFLAEVCREWERATRPVSDAGIRTANLRIGIVLSRQGGALKQMLLPFRLGLGGRIGSGHQWWSWIHIDDLVAAVWHILQNSMDRRAPVPSEAEGSSPARSGEVFQRLSGPVNLVAPNQVTNSEFTQTLARALHRPAVMPIPAFAARLAFGELADEGLLASAKAQPGKLLVSGFHFRFPILATALTSLLHS
jgi:uncharacterized protein (TIGR01777 family)